MVQKIYFDFTINCIGPELLEGVLGSALVQHPDGGVYLLFKANVYYLQHAQKNAWTFLSQKITVPRNFMNAFIIPDQYVKCFTYGQ